MRLCYYSSVCVLCALLNPAGLHAEPPIDPDLVWARKVASQFLESATGSSPLDSKGFLNRSVEKTIRSKQLGFWETMVSGEFRSPRIISQMMSPSGTEAVFSGVLKGDEKKTASDADFVLWLAKRREEQVWSVRFMQIDRRAEGFTFTRIPLRVILEDYLSSLGDKKIALGDDQRKVLDEILTRRKEGKRGLTSILIEKKKRGLIAESQFLTAITLVSFMRSYSDEYVTLGCKADKRELHIVNSVGPSLFPSENFEDVEIPNLGKISHLKVSPTQADSELNEKRTTLWMRLNLSITYDIGDLKDQDWNVCVDSKKYGVFLSNSFTLRAACFPAWIIHPKEEAGIWNWRSETWFATLSNPGK